MWNVFLTCGNRKRTEWIDLKSEVRGWAGAESSGGVNKRA